MLDNVNDIPYVVMVLGDLLRGTSQDKVSPSSQSWFIVESMELQLIQAAEDNYMDTS